MKKSVIIIVSIIVVVLSIILIIILSPYKIKLNGDKEIIINYKDTYIEKGANITKLGIILNQKQVKITSNINTNQLGEYIVTYSYKNTKETRKVIVRDIEKPVIALKKDDVTIFVNEDYIEYGATAVDNYDGDLSKKIKIDNEDLDTSKKGDYEVKYSVCDAHDNCNTVTRKITVKKSDIFYGTFKQKTDLQSSILKLRGSDKTFTLDINLCSGFAKIKGSYTVKNNMITLNFKSKQYEGYANQNDTKYKFSISNNDNIKFQSPDVMCGPFNADIYERIK